MIAFLLHPVSLMAYAVVAGASLLLWGLGSWDDGRRARGACALSVAAVLIIGGFAVAVAAFEPPYCPAGQRLHGAAGRILWCETSPIRLPPLKDHRTDCIFDARGNGSCNLGSVAVHARRRA